MAKVSVWDKLYPPLTSFRTSDPLLLETSSETSDRWFLQTQLKLNKILAYNKRKRFIKKGLRGYYRSPRG